MDKDKKRKDIAKLTPAGLDNAMRALMEAMETLENEGIETGEAPELYLLYAEELCARARQKLQKP